MTEKAPCDDGKLTCSGCLKQSAVPRTLCCQHSFCHECLSHMATELPGGQCLLMCPTCSKVSSDEQGLPPPAFNIIRSQEVFLHSVSRQGPPIECPRHQRPVEVFCYTCEELICTACVRQTHESHVHHWMHDLISDVVGSTELNTCDKELVLQGKAVEQQIRALAKEARTAVDQAEQRLVWEVRKAIQEKRDVISFQARQNRAVLSQVMNCMELVKQSIEQDASTDSKENPLETLEAAVCQMKKIKWKPAEEVDVVFHESRAVLEECGNLGQLQYSHLHQYSQISNETLRPAQCDRKSQVELVVKRSDGSPRTISSSLISCQLTASCGPQPVSNCDLTETSPGVFTISFTPVTSCSHRLQVQMAEKDIPSSPFDIKVIPSPHSRGHPLAVIPGLDQPHGVAVSRRGEVFVTEAGAHRVSVFKRTQRPQEFRGVHEYQRIGSFGSKGSGRDQFESPWGVAVSCDEHVIVTDFVNHRIQVFTMAGELLHSIDGKREGPLQFIVPADVAVLPSGQVAVLDMEGCRVVVLNEDLTGSCYSFGKHGRDQGEFLSPSGLAVDSGGLFYVADSGAKLVRKLSPSGIHLGDLDRLFAWQCPAHVAVDLCHNVYVSDSQSHQITIFSSESRVVKLFGSKGSGDGELNEPQDLACDSDGNLFVCDCGNNRVVVF